MASLYTGLPKGQAVPPFKMLHGTAFPSFSSSSQFCLKFKFDNRYEKSILSQSDFPKTHLISHSLFKMVPSIIRSI